jgi:hypothetical protein
VIEDPRKFTTLTPDQKSVKERLGVGANIPFAFNVGALNPAADVCAECVNVAVKAGYAPAMARLVCGQMGHCKDGAVGSVLPGLPKAKK